MAYNDDPLADYNPGFPSDAYQGSDETHPHDYDNLPDDIEDPFSEERLSELGLKVVADDTRTSVPTDAYEGPDDRDYSTGEDFPVEEYGRYADHYPEHAAQISGRRQENERRKAEHQLAGDVEGTALRVLDTLRDCLAAMHERSGAELIDMFTYALASENTMRYLDETYRKTYQRLSEVLVSEYAEERSRVVDLTDVPGLNAVSSHVRAELALVNMRIGTPSLPKTPTATWRALVNYVQRIASRQRAMDLVEALDANETDEDCMAKFREMEPPSSSRALQNASFSQSAQDWEESDLAAEAEAPGFRISSGYPTLDFAFTQKNAVGRDIEPRGTFAPGELHIIAAPTGNGKSAAARRLITSAAEDLVVGWGREHDKVLIAITEEAPKIVYQVAGLGQGQPFHHLAKNVIIATVGASRRRFIHAIWDCVVDAYHRHKETGMPLANCGLPSFVVLDYVGGLIEDGEGADTTAIEKTANLCMRGIAAWDVEMMEEFSGESFAAYAGMSWPSGMDAFRPAVLGFAQFRKLAEPQWYDPTKRGISVDDFVVPNSNGEPGWEVLPGDFRLPAQGEVRGSGILINHATSLMILHRSRPQKNPKITDEVTGRQRLVDDRARWLLIKTRNGTDIPFIEMRFDSIPSGLRGQFFDRRAEIAIERGLLQPTECYREVGDPILPRRPMRTAFDGIAY